MFLTYGATYFDPVELTITSSVTGTLDLDQIGYYTNDIVCESIPVVATVAFDVTVEQGRLYSVFIDDGAGKTVTATIFVPFKALPSARLEITNPTVIGGTGQYLIAASGNAPYDVAPLGQGTAAGVLYTSAASLAGSYSHVVGLTAIESAILTNLVLDGELATDPFAAGWTTDTAIYSAGFVAFLPLTAGTVTIPIDTVTTPISTVRWLVGVWLITDNFIAPSGTIELVYNGVTIASSLASPASGKYGQFLSAVITPTGVLKEFDVVYDGSSILSWAISVFQPLYKYITPRSTWRCDYGCLSS